MAAKERVVSLSVKAKDEFSGVLKKLETAGRKTQLQFASETRSAIKATGDELRNLKQQITSLSQAENVNRQELGNLLVAQNKLIERSGVLKDRLYQVQQTLAGGTTRGGFNAFSKLADDLGRVQAEAAKAERRLKVQASAQARLNAEVGKGFAAWSRQTDAEIAAAAAAAKSERVAKLREAAQSRLNNQVKTGFSTWSQYVDTVNRVRTAEEAAIKTAERKAAIQERLNNSAKSGFAAWSQSVGSASGKNEKASVEAVVPAIKAKETASKKAAAADRDHADAMNDAAAAAKRMGSALPGARDRNKGKKGDEQEVEVMGLKPWQLVNLGYQVNDVISGLAMGQAPVQILAQQAGQFAQIWPNVMVGLARSLPMWGGLAAAMTPVIAAISRTAKETKALKAFTAELALSADGARYNAAALVTVAKNARSAGVAFDDAKASISAFMREGVSQQNIAPLLEMAKQLAKVTGQSVPDASKRLAQAFTGNVSDVRELDRELNFLTATQYEQIRAMEAAGNSSGALATAQDALRAKLASSVQPATLWKSAVKDLKSAWDSLVTAIQNSGIIEVGAAALNGLAYAAKGAAIVINGAVGLFEEDSLSERYGRLNKERRRLERQMGQAKQSNESMFGVGAEPSGEMKRLQVEINKVEADYQEVVDLIKKGTAAQRETTAAAAETAAATEEQKKNQVEIDAVVQAHTKSLKDQFDTTLLTSREQFIQNSLLDARNEAMAKAVELGIAFSNLTSEQTEMIRQQAGALFDRNKSVDLQGDLGSFVDKVTYAESSGKTDARPIDPKTGELKSSALGLGQFIESTWLSMFKRYFPDRAEGMTNAAILALRKDAAMSKKMVELYAQENAKVLEKAGIAVTETSLYLSHFLGPNGAAGVMAASASTPVSNILKPGQINANESVLRGKNAGQVRDWAAGKMGATSAEVDAGARLLEIEEDRAETVTEYNKGAKERLADQQFELENMRLSAREAAIAKAIRDEELQAKEAGLALSEKERAEIARVTGELFDRQNVDAEVNRLLEQRAIIQERLSLAKASGDQSEIAAATSELADLDGALTSAIDKAIAFWEAIGGEGAKVAIANLELHKQKVEQTAEAYRTQYIPSAEQLNQQIAETGSNALSTFAQQVAAGEASFKSFFAAVSAGIGQMLVEIGQAIMKQTLLNAISGMGGGGGAGGWINNMMMAAVRHEGGMAGGAGATRMVDPAIFAGATRYHTGGIPGLKPNEVPAILENDEEVITAEDSRHRNNGGGQLPSIKMVNVLDPADIFERALATEVGEKIMLNFMSNRSQQINGMLRG